jgi:chromosome segregation ATPase
MTKLRIRMVDKENRTLGVLELRDNNFSNFGIKRCSEDWFRRFLLLLPNKMTISDNAKKEVIEKLNELMTSIKDNHITLCLYQLPQAKRIEGKKSENTDCPCDTFKDLEYKVGQLELEKRTRNKEVESLQRTISELHNQIEKSNQHRLDLQSELAEVKNEVEELNKETKAREQLNERNKETIEKLRNNLNECKNQVQKLEIKNPMKNKRRPLI